MDELREYLKKKLGLSDEQYQQLVDEAKKDNPVNKLVQNSKTSDEKYQEVFNNPNSTLTEIKAAKIEQLRKACENDILNGFFATIGTTEYFFSFDREAQSNFTGVLTLLNSGLITTVPEWTVKNNGVYERINMTVDEFKQVTGLGLQIKDSKISRLRNELIPLVELTTTDTKEKVDAIVW